MCWTSTAGSWFIVESGRVIIERNKQSNTVDLWFVSIDTRHAHCGVERLALWSLECPGLGQTLFRLHCAASLAHLIPWKSVRKIQCNHAYLA